MEFPAFQCVPTASRPVTGHHWEEPGSIFFTPSHQVFIHIDKIPLSLLFSRLSCPSSLSLSSCERCSSALIFVALHWTCSGKSMSLLYWGAQHWTQHTSCVSPVLSRGAGSPPSTCWPRSAWCSPGGWWPSLPSYNLKWFGLIIYRASNTLYQFTALQHHDISWAISPYCCSLWRGLLCLASRCLLCASSSL